MQKSCLCKNPLSMPYPSLKLLTWVKLCTWLSLKPKWKITFYFTSKFWHMQYFLSKWKQGQNINFITCTRSFNGKREAASNLKFDTFNNSIPKIKSEVIFPFILKWVIVQFWWRWFEEFKILVNKFTTLIINSQHYINGNWWEYLQQLSEKNVTILASPEKNCWYTH